jgi:hypothetical protein
MQYGYHDPENAALYFYGSAQEFVKVLNWRGFLKPTGVGVYKDGSNPSPVGVAIKSGRW